MAEFEPITTQEQLDAALDSRLQEELAKFSDYEELKKKNADYEKTLAANSKTIAQLQGQVKSYEVNSLKSHIARELGIPEGMAGRLCGETEEDIRQDAQTMAGFFSTSVHTPLADTETVTNAKNENLRSMLQDLRGE